MPLQASLTSDDYTASINRVTWSPDGTLFGVAYSKHIVQIYSYHGGDDLRNHLEQLQEMEELLSTSASIRRNKLSFISKLLLKTPMAISLHGRLQKMMIVVNGRESPATNKHVMSRSITNELESLQLNLHGHKNFDNAVFFACEPRS